MIPNKTLVVIVGPTAVGKTAMAIQLAKNHNTEIISADSRQIYQEMEIGTAKPTLEELGAVPHHLINTHQIEESYDAGQFVKDAKCIAGKIFKKKDIAVMVGGSGLYVKAFCEGLNEMPDVSLAIREELNDHLKNHGLAELLVELEKTDNVFFHQVDQKNPQRVIRALEVIRASGQPFSSFRKKEFRTNHDFNIVKIGLEMDRTELYERIDNRMDMMIARGLFEEAESLFAFKDNNALQTVGYQEIFGFFDKEYNKEEAIRLLKRNSRRYAKRQMTWFKKDSTIHWFDPKNESEISEFVQKELDKPMV